MEMKHGIEVWMDALNQHPPLFTFHENAVHQALGTMK